MKNFHFYVFIDHIIIDFMNYFIKSKGKNSIKTFEYCVKLYYIFIYNSDTFFCIDQGIPCLFFFLF